jgi:hypothetical protein
VQGTRGLQKAVLTIAAWQASEVRRRIDQPSSSLQIQ